MKKFIFILALLTMTSWPGLTAQALVYWSENFNGFSQEWTCQLADCGLVPGVPPGYTEFHANTMGTPDATTAITTAAHMGTPGANNRGFRITFGGNSWPTGESVLKKNLGGHKTGAFFLRWYQRDSDPGNYGHFQKLFRIKQDSSQILIPEWQNSGSGYKMNLWDAATNSNHFFPTAYAINNPAYYTPGTWKCYEIKFDLVNKVAEFWVEGVSQGTLNAASWWTTGWYVANIEIGGNQYMNTTGATIDYDDIILSDTYNGCGTVPPGDTTAPILSETFPLGSQSCPYSPQTTTIQVDSSEVATCRFSASNVSYDLMTGTMSQVSAGSGIYRYQGSVSLPCNAVYLYYIRCRDGSLNTSNAATAVFSILPEDTIPIELGTIGIGSGGAYLPGSGGAFIQN